MKKMINITAILLAMMALPAFAHHQKLTQAEIPHEHTYIPKGYDSNDNVELIVEGYLPNLCFKTPHTRVDVEGKQINVDLMAWTSEDDGVACAEMVVPFVHVFSVGVLDMGNYTVVINGEKTGELFVEESSSSSIDDYIYANVESIKRIDGERSVVLKGHNPSFCLEFDRYEISHNESDVYSIQPIMKQVSDFCPLKMVPFEIEVAVPKELKRDKVLLHVRAMNGKSVNRLFYERSH